MFVVVILGLMGTSKESELFYLLWSLVDIKKWRTRDRKWRTRIYKLCALPQILACFQISEYTIRMYNKYY